MFSGYFDAQLSPMRPNFIVIQPDDHYFFKEWNPPGQFDGGSSLAEFPRNSNGLSNINRIREDGIEMQSAYAASTMCGTSRYSTITGRYPSRSSYGRYWDEYSPIRDVKIPRTKLEDVRGIEDPNDCSENNIAALLQRNGYRTGMVGKWHLTSDDGGAYSYERIQDDIKGCGFHFAEAIYKENMWGDWYGDATHNMEHVTSEAIRFIEDAVAEEGGPFFLYFNPTVPHSSSDVTDALQHADCQDTVNGRLSKPPQIPYGMTADFGGDCGAYRQSVLDRGGYFDDKLAGAVWVDDAIGSLFQLLESLNVIDNTFILFQLDHGEDTKGSLFEGGSRIVQFIHYPKLIPSGSSFNGLVSTIDVAPTIADVANIPEFHRYNMDGKSWMPEVVNGNHQWSTSNDRCVFVEEGVDRSIRCGCYKYIKIQDSEAGFTVREAKKAGVSIDTSNFYYLCDKDTGMYINSPEMSPELQSTRFGDGIEEKLIEKVECHLKRTDPSGDPTYNRECDGPLATESSQEYPPDKIETHDDSSENLWSDNISPSPVPVPSLTPQPTRETRSPTIRPSIRQTAFPTINPTNGPSTEPSVSATGHTISLRPTQRPTNDITIGSDAPIFSSTDSLDSSNSTEYDLDLDLDCLDDPDYLYAGINGNDCRWVIQNDRCERTDPESKLPVGKMYCPESCSFCQNDDGCFDNPHFQWKGQDGSDCAWIEENGGCERIRDADDGTTIQIGKHFCPESCGFCELEGNV